MGHPDVGYLSREGCGGAAVATTILCAWSTRSAQLIPHEVLTSAENKQDQDQGCFFLLTYLARVRTKKIIGGVGEVAGNGSIYFDIPTDG